MKIIIIHLVLILSICTVSAQEINYVSIEGLVIGDDLKHVSFATIVSKKTDFGTISSENGNFSIRAEESDTLTFSSIGYKTKLIPVIKLDKEKNYIILSREIYQLGDVNVLGFTKWEEFKYDFMAKELKPMEQKILVIKGLPNPYKILVPNTELSANPISMIYQLFNKKAIIERKQKRWKKIYKKSWQEYNRKIK